MRASASAGAPGRSRSALIGERVDLTYPYQYLGAGPETLAELAAGRGDFAAVAQAGQEPADPGRRRRADAPGRRRDRGARRQGRARARRRQGRLERLLRCCTRAASRVGGLDLGFVPGEGGLKAAEMATVGTLDVVFLLGADEIDVAPGAFVVYIGTHGDRGAHRADVILPGAAYTEKSGLYVNTEGRVQMAARAAFPPGDAREDWAILRALSDVLGKQAALRLARGTARRAVQRASASAAHRRHRGRQSGATSTSSPALGGAPDKAPFGAADRGLLSDQSDRARLRGHGRMLGHRRRRRRHDGGGVRSMAELWTSYLWPLIVIGVRERRAARASC